MSIKLYLQIASGAAFGAAAAWAVTADYYDSRIKAVQELHHSIAMRQERVIREQGDRIEELEDGLSDSFKETSEISDPATPTITTLEDGAIVVQQVTDDLPGFDQQTLVNLEHAMAGESEKDVRETVETTRARLAGIIEEYTGLPLEEQNDPLRFEHTRQFDDVQEKFKNEPPFVISQQMYVMDDALEDVIYDKEHVTWYTRGRVLVGDDDELIEDVAMVVGFPALTRFGEESNSPDTVYVRNRRLRTDYEVSRDDENDPPLHIRYSMTSEEFATRKANGTLRLRDGDG